MTSDVLEQLPSVVQLISIFSTITLGILTLYFKWLISSFKKLEQAIADNGTTANQIQASLIKMVDDHETKDQTRHEENLYRFERISVALARLGSDNGTHIRKN